MSIESVMPSNHLILYSSLFLLPSIIPSIKVFTNESILHSRWPKYWSFSSSISPSNEYSGLISFRIDWLDLLAVQGTLKSLLQHHSSKANTWKQPKYPLTDEWLKKMWYRHIIEYYSIVKKNEIVPLEAIWMGLEIIILSEVSKTEKDEYMISLIYGILKMLQINLFVKQKHTHRHWKQTYLFSNTKTNQRG